MKRHGLVCTYITAGGAPAVGLVGVPLEEVLAGVLLLQAGVERVDGLLVLTARREETDGDVKALVVVLADEPGVTCEHKLSKMGRVHASLHTHEGWTPAMAENWFTSFAVMAAFQPQQKPTVPTDA